MVMPHSIRAWIPLRYWPDFCVPCSTLFDIVFKYWDENEWEPGCGDPPSCMIEVLKQDIEDKTITKSDAISIIFALLFGEICYTRIWINNHRHVDFGDNVGHKLCRGQVIH